MRKGQAWGIRLWRTAVLLAIGIVVLRSLPPLLHPGSFMYATRWVLYLPAVALGVMIAASWIPGAWLWRIALVGLVFAETLAWNQQYVPYLLYAPDYARHAGKQAPSNEFWADNYRGTDPFQNQILYTLKPAMHGYEPVFIERVRNTLCGDRRGRKYQRSVKNYEITAENHRGNLFAKRSFWLARQYIRGPLRSKHSLFPSATTVFLPEAGDDVPIPRVEEGQVPARAVSDNVKEISFISKEQLADFNRRLNMRSKRRSLSMPGVEIPGVHSALRLEFTSTETVVVKSNFRDRTGRRQMGKTAHIQVRGERSIALELPVPDFDIVEAQVYFEMLSTRGQLTLDRVDLLADLDDENHLIDIVERRPNYVIVEVGELAEARVLTFIDAHYPGWHAYVDGREVPILLANDAFKAVVLEPGTHRVEFHFRPWRVYAGVGISLGTALLAMFFVVGTALAERKRRVPIVERSEAPVEEADGAQPQGKEE